MTDRDHDDRALLRAWIDGDAHAGKRLIERYHRSVLLFFFNKVGAASAEDLTQETFTTLCDRKLEFRGDASVRTYLFGIARWKVVHHVRRHRRPGERFDPLTDSIDAPEDTRSITSAISERREQTLLVHALRSLALDDQILIELKDYEGLTGPELAAVYELPRDTIVSRVTRARKRLAAAVKRLAESDELLHSTLTGLDDCMRQIRARAAELTRRS